MIALVPGPPDNKTMVARLTIFCGVLLSGVIRSLGWTYRHASTFRMPLWMQPQRHFGEIEFLVLGRPASECVSVPAPEESGALARRAAAKAGHEPAVRRKAGPVQRRAAGVGRVGAPAFSLRVSRPLTFDRRRRVQHRFAGHCLARWITASRTIGSRGIARGPDRATVASPGDKIWRGGGRGGLALGSRTSAGASPQPR
jgi:hypothetical protein